MYEIDWVARRRYWVARAARDLACARRSRHQQRRRSARAHHSADTRSRFREKLQASLSARKRRRLRGRTCITRFDGSTGWILLRRKTFFQDGPRASGRPVRSGWIVDITDRKRGRRSKCAARLHGAFIKRCDLLDRPGLDDQTWNGGAERLYGYSAAEAIGIR